MRSKIISFLFVTVVITGIFVLPTTKSFRTKEVVSLTPTEVKKLLSVLEKPEEFITLVGKIIPADKQVRIPLKKGVTLFVSQHKVNTIYKVLEAALRNAANIESEAKAVIVVIKYISSVGGYEISCNAREGSTWFFPHKGFNTEKIADFLSAI